MHTITSLLVGATLLMGGVQSKSQAKKPEIKWQGPKRLIQMASLELKASRITNGAGGFSIGAGSGNVSGSGGASGPASVELAEPQVYAGGVTDMAKTVFGAFRGFSILEPEPIPADGGTAPPPPGPALPKPEFLVRATITDLTVRKKSGGLRIGAIGGGKESYVNKVVIDMRLIDPESSTIVAVTKAVGEKGSDSNTLALLATDPSGLSQPLVGFGDFKESPLGDATRLALEDGLAKLCAELMKFGWTTTVVDVQDGKILCEVVEGVAVGDQMEAIIPGKTVTDPKTGRRIGETKATLLGRVQVTEIEGSLVTATGVDGYTPEVGVVLRPVKK